MNKDEQLDRIRDVGERIIADLPNINDLRERATSLHKYSVEIFKHGDIEFKKVKYGFTDSNFLKIKELEKEYIKDMIKLDAECDCYGHSQYGLTCFLLPNGETHLSWCNKGRQFEIKYLQLKERLNAKK